MIPEPDKARREAFESISEFPATTVNVSARDFLMRQLEHMVVAPASMLVQAWDEGYQAGVREEQPGWTKNPYRTAK